MSESISKKIKISYGISLAEIVVTVAIFSVIMMAVLNFGAGIFSFNRTAGGSLSAQTGARKVLKTMVEELRTTLPSSLGAYPISSAGTSSLTFFANVDSDDLVERVRFFVDNGTLKRGLIKPSGNPLSYSSGSETFTTLVTGITNGASSVFEYYDQFYSGTTTPLSEPVQVTDIRLVRIYLVIDEDPNMEPGAITVESQVTLRNLKDNL